MRYEDLNSAIEFKHHIELCDERIDRLDRILESNRSGKGIDNIDIGWITSTISKGEVSLIMSVVEAMLYYNKATRHHAMDELESIL